MRSSCCTLCAPSRAAVWVLHEPDVKGEIAIDWPAFKWAPSAYYKKPRALAHTEKQRAGQRVSEGRTRSCTGHMF